MATITLSGRIGKEPELKQINDKLKVTTFSVAESRSVKKGNEREYVTDWFRVKMFSDMSWLKSGDLITVSGEMINNNYTDKEGKTIYQDEIIGNKLTLLYRKKESSNTLPTQAEKDFETFTEKDLPF